MKNLHDLVCLIKEECSNPDFIHHEWFWDYHLAPFKKLVEKYGPEYGANRVVLEFSVYLHDIAKIRAHLFADKGVDHAEKGAEIAGTLLTESSFDLTEGEKQLIIACVRNHGSGKGTTIEEKLIASIDALSHFTTPFFFIWWKENPGQTVNQLCKDNVWKAEQDWKKITIPEIREIALPYYESLRLVLS